MGNGAPSRRAGVAPGRAAGAEGVAATPARSGLGAPRAAVSRPRVWALLGGVVGVAAALVMTRHAWGPHVIAGGDITADLVRSDYGIAHLVLHGRLDGWFPRFMLGHEEFLFNGPGVTWSVALVRAATFGALSTTGAVKVVALGAVAAQPIAVAYLARSLRLDPVAAALAGVLSLTVSVGFGIGMEGLFVNGLLSHQLGAIPFFVAFGAGLRLYDDPSPRRTVVAAVAAAALAITHLISVMVLAVMFPIALVFRMAPDDRRARVRGLLGLAVSACVAVGLAGFWVVPFLAHRDLHGPVVTWGTDPFDQRVATILRGQLVYEPAVVKLVMLAWVVAVVRAAFGRREHLVLLAVPAVYLVVAHVALAYAGPGDITLQLANRGLGYAGVLALFPVAALGALGARRAGAWLHVPGAPAALSLLALVLAAGLALRDGRAGLAGEVSPPTRAFRDAAVQLRELVPVGARFSLTRDYPGEIPRVGVVEPARWLAWASGVDTLNAFNPESSNAGAVSYTADGPDPGEHVDDWIRALRRLGVRDVVVDRADVDVEMRSSTLASLVWHEGPVEIYALRAEDGSPPAVLLDAGDAVPQVAFARRDPEHLGWEVSAPRAFAATLAVAWSPKWHLTLDGRTAPAHRTGDGLVRVDVPAGAHTLRLAYRADLADRAGVLLTLAMLALVVRVPVGRRRRRSAGPAQPGGEERRATTTPSSS